MPRYLRYIFDLALKNRRLCYGLLALLLLSVMMRLGEPYLYKVIVDTLTDGLVSGLNFTAFQLQTLLIAVAIWFAIAIILNITSAQSAYLTWKIGNRSSQDVNMAGYRRLLRLDYLEHTKRHSSKLSKIVDNADISMWEMTNWWLHRFSSAFLGFLGMLVIAILVSWQMTLIAISVIPPGLWFIIRRVKKYEDEQRRVNKFWEEKHEHLEDIFLKRHAYFVNRAADSQLNLNKKWRFVEMLNPDAFARFLVLGAGIFFVRDGSITLGTLFMFMGLLNEILLPLHLLSDILPQYSRRAQQIERFLNLLKKKDVIVSPPAPQRVPKIGGEVVLNKVWFSYRLKSKKGFALRNVSFAIHPGQTVALVGHSGSGKSTIMALLNRLVDPDRGTITIDGINLKKFNQEELKKNVGTVLQENAMYNETVAENIAYGNPKATRDEIIHAAKQAYTHEFIKKLPSGYDTIIGERGVRLSGGEKQRVAVARAILKNPRIVILDEPTSALDSITEMEVQKGLNELMKARSTLIIAHRLSTVRHADVTVVLEEGKVICRGSHKKLMRSCPVYKQMVDLQIGGFLAEE